MLNVVLFQSPKSATIVSSPSFALLTIFPHGSTMVECPQATYSDVGSLAIFFLYHRENMS